jgi:hypothetical protein
MVLNEVGFQTFFATHMKGRLVHLKKRLNGMKAETLAHSTLNYWRLKIPRYDFKCNICGGIQEVTMGFGDSTLPVCCSESMSKIYQATPAVFKGGGWGGK